MKRIHKAVNWTIPNRDYIDMLYNQMRAQFWVENEIPVSKDKTTWDNLDPNIKEVYRKVLGGLTLLDTKQGGEGMPLISLHLDDPQCSTLANFMAMMEDIHAKSYSHIFMTICSKEETEGVFRWVEENPYLQKKADIVTSYYNVLRKPEATPKEVYMALVASVFLESFLFYSGFFFPLFLGGQGIMTNSCEIINLILLDETIHGVTGGLFAQDIYREKLTEVEREEVKAEMMELLEQLYENELQYTADVYAPLGDEIISEVGKFLRYNANRAFMNLGYEAIFEEEDLNPIVQNGLKTETRQHDPFKTKGNGYAKAMNIEPLQDEDFMFDGLSPYTI